jgi:uncharacterized membrane protein YdjX (TVP38/TMEM64 family)
MLSNLRMNDLRRRCPNGEGRPFDPPPPRAGDQTPQKHHRETQMSAGKPAAAPFRMRRLLPLAILVAALVAFFAFGLQDWFDLDQLRRHRLFFAEQVRNHYLLSLIAYVAVYALVVAVSVPGATVLTIAGGFLFGQFVGCAASVTAATTGAAALFLAARTALGEPLRSRAGPWLRRLEKGFAENALSYLLFLRLVPVFPFFAVNLVPAFLGVKLRTYLLGTFLGIIPGTFVYAAVGAGLGELFEAGAAISTAELLSPQIIVALAGLALLALVPVAYKKWAGRKSPGAPPDRGG